MVSFLVLLLFVSSVLLLVVSFRFRFCSLYLIILVSVVLFSILFLFMFSVLLLAVSFDILVLLIVSDFLYV
jgi:hypothetical protein